MKTRMGFVSNSSSSSFIVYGMDVNEEELYNVFENHYKLSKEEISKFIDKEKDLKFYEISRFFKDKNIYFEYSHLKNHNTKEYILGKDLEYEEDENWVYDLKNLAKDIDSIAKFLNKNLKLFTGSGYY